MRHGDIAGRHIADRRVIDGAGERALRTGAAADRYRAQRQTLDRRIRHAAKQAVIQTAAGHRQIRKRLPQSVEIAGELAGCISDRHESRTTPNIRAGAGGRGVDVGGQRVARAGCHRHQLQLVGIVDAGRILRGQHRIGPAAGRAAGIQRSIAVDDDPACCAGRAGESETAEIGGDLHLRGGQPRRPGRRA